MTTFSPWAHAALVDRMGADSPDRSRFLDVGLTAGHAPRAFAKGGSVRAAAADVARLASFVAAKWAAKPPYPDAHVQAAIASNRWSRRVADGSLHDDPLQLAPGEKVDTIWATYDLWVRRLEKKILEGMATIYEEGAADLNALGAAFEAGILLDLAGASRRRGGRAMQGSTVVQAVRTIPAAAKDGANIVGTAGRQVGLPFPTMPGAPPDAPRDPHRWDRLQTLLAAGALGVAVYTAWPAIAGTRRSLGRRFGD